jgi:hypothetical protein
LIFADQKTGLMPEWTWKEGITGDFDSEIRKSPARRNDVLAAKMSKIGVESSYDFWRMWRQVMVAIAEPNTALSAMTSKDTRVQSIDRLIDSHRNDARKNGIRSVLNSYTFNTDGRKGEGADGMVGSGIAQRILKSAGITPTLKNAIAAYEALKYSRRESANDELNVGQQSTTPPKFEGYERGRLNIGAEIEWKTGEDGVRKYAGERAVTRLAENDSGPSYNQRIAALKDLITCLKK